MSKQIKVIKRELMPVKYPVLLTAVAILYMDYYNANGVVIGIVSTFLAIIWAVVIITHTRQKYCDIKELLKDDANNESVKQTFKQKVDELQQKNKI